MVLVSSNPVSSTEEHLFHTQGADGSTPSPGTTHPQGVEAVRRTSNCTPPAGRRTAPMRRDGLLLLLRGGCGFESHRQSGVVAQLAEHFDLARLGSRRRRGIEALMVMLRVLTPGSRVRVLAIPPVPHGTSRKVADSGVQPASKAGPATRLRVRLLHLPRVPDGAIGSTPGSEPGDRGSSPRSAAIDPMRS